MDNSATATITNNSNNVYESSNGNNVYLPTTTTEGFSFSDVFMRAVKYAVEGLAVAVAAYFIPRRSMDIQEIIMIAITAAAVFAILDLYSPVAAGAARSGAGFGIGAMQVGFTGFPLI